MRSLILLLLLLRAGMAYAAHVDTVAVYSPSMHKDIKTVVILPDGYDRDKHYPVVYLLHGYSGNYADYVRNIPGVAQDADAYHLIIVCPDGRFNSWYFDSPVDTGSHYETFVSSELVGWIDNHYSTIRNRSGRAITGLSMGGHGALYLSFRHQDIYGAAGSMSGGVDLRPFPDNWNIKDQLGPYDKYPERWEDHSVVNLVYLLHPNTLPFALIFDCGTDDFFYKVNVNLHNLLVERNIPHDFITRPGGHAWTYWSNSIRYQLLFFHRFFQHA
ncbi:MAG TPA: alpha/beta hydrolase family protein [Dinghuibacter sp.]|jgi:S-formylglutathione hydrolase FrmB|uniref:alpha/beta hydrolase n=1 Tax=Dinghuibacter sp. TaxID=2024697 RepID=UPI002BDF8332|nr:alpha/beta hydrolase family protein [Dinghuibacter sp.]HTJ12095.1 alpha/beta hydrolase family protein [Dinghuibacter sp.]